jgi:hypothetical protein
VEVFNTLRSLNRPSYHRPHILQPGLTFEAGFREHP